MPIQRLPDGWWVHDEPDGSGTYWCRDQETRMVLEAIAGPDVPPTRVGRHRRLPEPPELLLGTLPLGRELMGATA